MRIHNVKVLMILMMLFISQNGLAVSTPVSLAADSRIKQVVYQENQVVPINATDFINTQVIFGESESIVNVESGDDSAWSFHISPSLPNILNIKPTLPSSNSNLDVITMDEKQKRKYYRFHMVNIQENKDMTPTYTIAFVYPGKKLLNNSLEKNYATLQEKAIQRATNHPKNYNWDYSYHGNKSILPAHVFDDGQFTYLELRKNQPIPAVFLVDSKYGHESSVNVRSTGDYLVIQRVGPQFTLRNGLFKVVSLFNNKMIAQRRGDDE